MKYKAVVVSVRGCSEVSWGARRYHLEEMIYGRGFELPRVIAIASLWCTRRNPEYLDLEHLKPRVFKRKGIV